MPIYVPLSREGADRLRAVARQDRRSPRDQAAVILERYLRRARLPVDELAERRRELVPAG